MGVGLKLIDLDKRFHSLEIRPLLVNNFVIRTDEEREQLNEMIRTSYDSDQLDPLPSCLCKKHQGRFYEDILCEVCNTRVVSITEQPLESILWITTPEGVNTLISPMAWNILSKELTISGFNVLEWCVNPSYKSNVRNPAELVKIQEWTFPQPFQRSLNFFHEYFDNFIECFVKVKVIKGRAFERKELLDFIQQYRSCIFVKHVPIPSRLGLITEATSTVIYADVNMTYVDEAIGCITSITSAIVPTTQRLRETRTVKAIVNLAMYYQKFIESTLCSKDGWFRKHVFCSRMHFTFRAVISSLSEAHQYDEVHLPWGVAVQVLEAHITNKLMKRGMNPNACARYIAEHTGQYDELMDEIFQELIAESPYGGIPIILQRNPTLTRGSAQLLRVTRVKTEVECNTISMSVLVLKAPNADFDGDALNAMLILDRNTYDRLKRMAPHFGVLDLRRPKTISRNVAHPAPVLSTFANWLYEFN